YFPSEKFAICETYEVAEIRDAVAGMAAISESWGVPFDNLINNRFAYGASIGTCPINRIVQFRTLADMPECKKLLPADLAFVFGMPEKDANAVPVFAVKVVKDPSITINMMKDARTSLSFNKVHHDVQLEFKKEYKTTWEAFTKKNSGRCVAIMLGDAVLSCPMLMAPIANGKAAISANMDKWQAEEMAQRINFSLPLEVLITEVKMLD
ncbi:SecDF P1 head subdomain-containing protein, partial [Flavobacterium sp.]